MMAKKATISRATVANLELNWKIGSGFLSFGLYFIIGISESSWNSCWTETDSVWLQLLGCCTACASWALCPRAGVLPCGRAHGGSASCPPGSARAKLNSLWESRRRCPEPLHSFVALATASSFLHLCHRYCCTPKGCSYLLLWSPFSVSSDAEQVGLTFLVKRSLSSCTYSLPTDFGEEAHPEKNYHCFRVGFGDLRSLFQCKWFCDSL